MANFTLEMTFPKAVGAAGTGLDADHKVFKAYPGIPYRYFAAAVGGDPYYVWSISGAPSEMVIDSDTGEVTWSNPTTGTHSNITVTVTDQSDVTDSATYDLVVGTSGFVFLDATAVDDSGAGTLVSPWKTIDKLYDQTTLGTSCAYFRAGTYDFTGVPVTTGGTIYDDRMQFSESAGRCTTWLAYPGETVTLNYGSDHTDPGGRAAALRLAGDNTYVDGFTHLDGFNKFLWMDRGTSRGLYVINNTFTNLGPGVDSSNSACVMFTHQTQTYNDVIVNNHTENIGYTDSTTCIFKFYDNIKSYCAFNTGDTDLNTSEAIAYKDSCGQFMNYRNNIVSDVTAIGGNNHVTAPYEGTFGETWFSRYKAPTWALEFNQDSQALQMYWERCTFEGPIHARHVDVNDGPFTFRNCVIVNENGANTEPYLTREEGATDGDWTGTWNTGRISCVTSATPTGTQNLAGNAAASIVDANGLLQGSYRSSYLGSWGFEIVVDAPGASPGGQAVFMVIF